MPETTYYRAVLELRGLRHKGPMFEKAAELVEKFNQYQTPRLKIRQEYPYQRIQHELTQYAKEKAHIQNQNRKFHQAKVTKETYTFITEQIEVCRQYNQQ